MGGPHKLLLRYSNLPRSVTRYLLYNIQTISDMSAQDYYSGGGGGQQGGYGQQQGYPQQQQYSQGSGYGGPQQSDHDNRGQSYNQQQGGPYGGSSAYPGGDQGQAGPDGERGLGATLVGGGAAGWAAHKAGGGLLSSLAGAAAGAIGANLIEHKFKKHKKDKKNHKDGRPRNYSGDSTSSSDSGMTIDDVVVAMMTWL